MTPDACTADAIADLLETLVNIPSVTGQEGLIADWIMARLRGRAGGELMRSGHSIVWRPVPSTPARPLVVLAGHVDTVPPQGNERARREDGKLFGLGATDMKGGDAVMLSLLATQRAEDQRFDVAYVFYDAEEGPSAHNGLRRLLQEMPWLRTAKLAILLEPTDLKLELGCNGVVNAEVTVHGKAAHSARPWTGVNAIERAAPWLTEITKFEPRPVTFAGAEFVETLQVTTLRAGRTRNVVPDELVANLNYRFTPDRTLADAERTLRALVPPGFEFAVVDAAPPGRACGDDPLVQDFVRRFGAKVAGKQGWTDVAQFTAAGVPAFNFGPGISELCHQAAEYCPIANLETACRWLGEFLAR